MKRKTAVAGKAEKPKARDAEMRVSNFNGTTRSVAVKVRVVTPAPRKVTVRTRTITTRLETPYRVLPPKAAAPVLVPVSRRGLVQRINRQLSKDDRQLLIARSARAVQDLGQYYVVTYPVGGAWPTHVDIEEFGRELGVLREWERLADE
jgi:hypothetical protein